MATLIATILASNNLDAANEELWRLLAQPWAELRIRVGITRPIWSVNTLAASTRRGAEQLGV